MSTYAPFAKPLYVMLKPVGAVCNLACDYCYYLEKSRLYQENPKHVMSDELLEKFIEQYINSQTMPQVLFTWHGGETLMRPLSFYKKAMELQKKYASDIEECYNVIHDNGIVFRKGDVDDLAQKLTYALEHPNAVRMFKWLAAEYVCTRFPWDKIVVETLKLYQK